MPEDYYSLLGVDPDASEEAILRAYRQRAAEHHPDVSDDPGADETFRRLNRAKQVLTDEERRREYDRLGHARYVDRRGWADRSAPPEGPWSAGDAGGQRANRPAGVTALFESLAAAVGDRPGGPAMAGAGATGTWGSAGRGPSLSTWNRCSSPLARGRGPAGARTPATTRR